ncbi:MAG: hypothetical protein LBO09_05420 [Candidatus Peribacteria bacterium]|jgi:hypothetical protein|nr:hypothetical protein [Candidatus Peribacteria bacterium]
MEQATEKENTSKMEKLEKTISEMMYATFENDSEKKYIYADVQEKNKDEDIVLFILKSTAKHLDISSEQLLQLINKHSFCSTNTPFTMFEEYQSALQNLIEQKKKELPDKDVENIILNIECSNFFELIRDITEGLHKQMFLLLDHITTLTKQEQQRVNQLISWR